MIIDHIRHKDTYTPMHDGFMLGFAFAEQVMREGAAVGRYELDGDRVYALVQEYEGKDNHPAFEVHREYIDMQFIVAGNEAMEYTHIDNCVPMTDYNPDKDMAFLTCNGEKTTMQMHAGDFAVFYPQDAHKPALKMDDGIIRKIVVKVKCN